MNFIDRRAAAAELLQLHAPEQWQNLRAAVQDCCESYTKHYSQQEHSSLTCVPENGNRLRLTLQLKPDHLERIRPQTNILLIAYDPKAFAISITSDDKSDVLLTFASDEQRLWLTYKNHEIDEDESCQLLLSAFLGFGKVKPREVASATPLRAATSGSMAGFH